MRIVEFTGFILLSGALHAATLVVAPLPGGGSSGGEGGASEVTLQAATPTLAAMVRDWDRPPEVSDSPALATPDTTAAPDRPAQDQPFAPRAETTALAAPHAVPDLPKADTRLPAPLVPLAQTDAAPLTAPSLPDRMPAPVTTTQRTPRSTAPQLGDTAPLSAALPAVDASPAAPRTAPVASLRPEPRPNRPVAKAKPAAKKASTAARPAQTAKGSGAKPATSTAPARTAPAPSGPSKAQLARLEQQWGAQITTALRRAHRPPRGAEGTVRLVISIAPSGRVTGVSLAGSSGNSRLDQAALAAVKRARFPRAPEGLTKSSYRFSQRLTVAR